MSIQKIRWTEEHEQFMRDNYGVMSSKEISTILGRTVRAVGRKADSMKLTEPSGPAIKWLPEHVEFLVANYADRGAGFVAERVGHNIESVRRTASRLGIKISDARWKEWRRKYADEVGRRQFGRPLSETRKANIASGLAVFYGDNERSAEVRRSISERTRGNRNFRGKTHTTEVRDRISNKLTGRKLSASHKKNISTAMVARRGIRRFEEANRVLEQLAR